MNRVIEWIKRKRKALLALGAGYLMLELCVALLVVFGIYTIG